MSLIDPTLGDLLDRLSILRLKIAQAEALARPVPYFHAEQTAILDRLPAQWQTTFEPALSRLFDVNELLWHETEALRAVSTVDNAVVHARLGLHILRLNDERATLIEVINTQAGEYRKEKLA
jgi:hypothetical protein